jgi:hypothetical protein
MAGGYGRPLESSGHSVRKELLLAWRIRSDKSASLRCGVKFPDRPFAGRDTPSPSFRGAPPEQR